MLRYMSTQICDERNIGCKSYSNLINTFLSKCSDWFLLWREPNYIMYSCYSPDLLLVLLRYIDTAPARAANNNIKFECALGNGAGGENLCKHVTGCRVTPGKSNRWWKRDKSVSLSHNTTRRISGAARSRIQTDLRVNQNPNAVPETRKDFSTSSLLALHRLV